MVRKSILPEQHETAGTIRFQTPANKIIARPAVLVDVDLGARQFQLRCVAMEDYIISVPLLVRHNLPDANMLQIMVETAPPGQQLNVDVMHERMEHARKRKQEEREPEQAAGGEETTPETPPAEITPTEDQPGPAEVNRLQLNCQCRYQSC